MKTRIVTLLLLLVSSFSAKAQFLDFGNSAVDSLLYGERLFYEGVNFGQMGEYEKAIEKGSKSCDVFRNILGEDHLYYVRSLEYLASYYFQARDFDMAVKTQTKVVRIVEHTDNLQYATSLYSLAVYYHSMGEYGKAIEADTKVLTLITPEQSLYVSVLINLAAYYSDFGNVREAMKIAMQAQDLCERLGDCEISVYATIIANLAVYHFRLKDYDAALKLGHQALDIREKGLGKDHPDYASSLADLSFFYSELDSKKAVELAKQSVSMLGEEHSDYVKSLGILAHNYFSDGDFHNAVKLAKTVNEIRKQTLSEAHPEYIKSLSSLAGYYFCDDQVDSAAVLLSKCVSLQKKQITSLFQTSTNRDRQSYWNASKHNMAFFPCHGIAAQTDAYNGEIYDNSALFAKGLLLNAETSLRDLILESGNAAVVKRYDEWQKIRTVLNRQYEKPIAERKLNCDSLENVAEQMERELLRSSKAYGDFTRNLTVTWQDVQKELGDADLAIEFLLLPELLTDTPLYVALTLKKGYDKPKMITLFEESELNAIPENRWYADTALCHLVWGQLGDELRGVKNVYFSPDGALYNIGIEHLPCSATENMGERYNMFRLSSTRELAIGHEQPSAKSSALYGGLQYYVPPTELLAYNQKKGYSWRTASRDVFEPLPETKTEVENISALLKGHNYDAPAIYAGDEGTEESFKALSGKRTRIIHLATHGCYITPDEADRQRKSEMQQRLAILRVGNDKGLGTEEDEALTRSYLAMSGGKMLWTSDTIPEGLDDGLLTAQEISRLDLRGCDLVVLSACETGLGDITSEGVMGLQRGFKKAGVQSIVMSLWKVADRPTQEFMTEFYRHLTAGEGKRASFLAAQHFLKEKYPTNLPQDDGRPPYWASFIILDPEVR